MIVDVPGRIVQQYDMEMKPGLFGSVVLFTLCAFFAPPLDAQTSISTPAPGAPAKASAEATPEERLAAIELEMTNAFGRVLQIVNQPVRAFAHAPGVRASSFQPGWFHEGATRPDFNTVDVRQSQELIYAKYQYVTSDLNPGVVFLGQELEFNAMTKYFYTNRSLPKHKLTEAEMLEINQLYRVIGRCESEIARLKRPPATETTQPAAQSDADPPIPGQLFERIRGIPARTRIVCGGAAIVGLVFLACVLRLAKRKSG